MNNLDDRLKELAESLLSSYEEAYNLCYPTVERIIQYEIKDIDLIEHTLDQALDIYTEKGFNLFIVLLLYYQTVNYQRACEYLEILKDDRKEEYDDYVKKYKKIK